ncbi:MAG: hypothetical protein LUE92_04615 [Clostridiales bacterium]|nr:hypothetical protein [Clostridiales bacterium]
MGIRITKKLLNNYKKYKREITFLEAELKELRTTDAGLGNSVINDYSTGYARPQSVVGFDYPLYDRRVAMLERRNEQVRAVEDWIAAIEDGQTRYVFQMRYLKGMNWVKIAERIGYSGKPDYVRLEIRDKYLRKMNIR